MGMQRNRRASCGTPFLPHYVRKTSPAHLVVLGAGQRLYRHLAETLVRIVDVGVGVEGGVVHAEQAAALGPALLILETRVGLPRHLSGEIGINNRGLQLAHWSMLFL